MKSYFFAYHRPLIALAVVVMSLCALPCRGAKIVDNAFFTLNIADDSWHVVEPSTQKQAIETQVEISRADASRQIIELARIDYIEMAFKPAEYLEQQIVGKANIFCRIAKDFSEISDTTFAHLPAKCVHFVKSAAHHDFYCTAIALNAGYSTLLVITSHRDDVPNVVGDLVGTLTFKNEVQPLTTVAQYVDAINDVLDRHSLPIGVNEHLKEVVIADSTTVELEIAVDYITQDGVNVPVFVQAMRDHWLKAVPSAYKLNSFTASIIDEGKTLRHVYVDSKGYDIGTLVITPTEYRWALKNSNTKKKDDTNK